MFFTLQKLFHSVLNKIEHSAPWANITMGVHHKKKAIWIWCLNDLNLIYTQSEIVETTLGFLTKCRFRVVSPISACNVLKGITSYNHVYKMYDEIKAIWSNQI